MVPLVHEAFSTREMGEEQDATESDESPSAIEMEEIPTAKVSMAWERKSSPKSKANEQVTVPVLELRLEEAHGRPALKEWTLRSQRWRVFVHSWIHWL